MESAKANRITDEVIRLMDLQVEALKEPILAMTVDDYDERRNRTGQLCGELGSD